MSVFTQVSLPELKDYLSSYDVGEVTAFEGIQAGVENSNFFVDTSTGRYVLTLVESIASDKVHTILSFVQHLNTQKVPCAQLVPHKDGALFKHLNSKPAVLMERLQGKPLDRPTLEQCSIMGAVLANAHKAVADYSLSPSFDIRDWCADVLARIKDTIAASSLQLIQKTLEDVDDINWAILPYGPVHADLFPDNVLFEENKLSGLIDFYHSCHTPFLYDLSVALNAWCFDEANSFFDHDKATAFLMNYQSERPLTVEERQQLLLMTRLAALRFWLSRLRDYQPNASNAHITVKNPEGMRRLLEYLSDSEIAVSQWFE